MSNSINECMKCNNLMEEGFVLDRGDGDVGRVETWIDGTPVPSFWSWSGFKTSDKMQYEIKTFRCVKCGFLESYAVGQEN